MTEQENSIKTEVNIGEIAKKLEKSTVYNMTLGSKELFHSNFWAWLINKYNAFVGVFFEDLRDKAVKVMREEKHCDLTLKEREKKGKKKVYIIENKLKSLPNKAQLLKYEKDNKNTFDKGIITGLIKPDFMADKELRNWQFMSYSDIAKKIREILKNLSENKKIDVSELDYKIIDEYCSVIGNVNKLVVNSLDDLTENRNIKKIRLGDICQKLKMAKFAEYLKGREEEIKSLALNYELEIHTDFSNGNALIDIDWKKVRDNGDTETRMGIQIQGNQYRRFIAKYPYDGTIETLFKEYKGKNWLEDKIVNGNNKTIFGKKTGMIKNYCKYETTEYKMVYQHWDITKNEKCTDYNTLIDIIIEDLKTAARII